MRFVVAALGALALVGLMGASEPAIAKKSKMGCEIGKEKWNATAGKCEASKAKPRKAAKKVAKKAPAKK